MIISAAGKIKVVASASVFVFMVIKLVSGMGIDHCYSDIGCFPLSDEFYHPTHRPFNVRPWHRRRIKTQFELYNRQHPEGYMLRPWNRHNLLMSGFNPMLETKIIVPGWLDNIKRVVWMKRMKDAFLWLWHPVNIIVIHWRNFTPYTLATANTRVVGAELANLLKFIEHELNYDRSYHHIVGHSLGAHIAGYCGDRLPGLGRITALDPARPFFQHMPKSVRLDRADARFVDAIHSDFTPENAIFLLMSFGMTTPVGHLDFYPNGPPLLQPGCLRDTLLSVRNGIQRGLEHRSLSVAFLESIRYLTACDHQRSHEWFIESITNRHCLFIGVRCNEFEGLINGRCTCDNSRSACAIMGIHADQMYLNKAHEDLWPPKSARLNPLRPTVHPSHAPAGQINPFAGELNQQLSRPVTKEQVYAQLKHHAHRLRYPPIPEVLEDGVDNNLVDGITEEDFPLDADEGLDTVAVRDARFIEYLRTTFLRPGHLRRSDHQASQRPSLSMRDTGRRRYDTFLDDDELELYPQQANYYSANMKLQHNHEQHRLLSDLDRDIETWYEDSSRWYLKTHNRPHYCVNQYQVLVFIGPLRTTTGLRHLRANLLISIIGSRGQLLNQRFIPRSANLDSFTMQPFFIILDGTYSLGTIKSVAIAWEARSDPDPVQATISFQSNLLENFQSLLPPPYRAKHPWLSETIKFDHSKAFRWISNRADHFSETIQRPATKARSLTHQFGQRTLQKRQDEVSSPKEDGCSIIKGRKDWRRKDSGQCKVASNGNSDANENEDLEFVLNDLDREASEQLIELVENDLDAEASQPGGLIAPALTSGFAAKSSHQMVPTSYHHHHRSQDQIARPEPAMQKHHNSAFLDEIYSAGDKITAELHNLGIHLDRYPEDTIVVSQVVISPLQATYGKSGKVGKVFCSPHPGYRLQRERTVRLVPNLLGNCQNMHQSIRVH